MTHQNERGHASGGFQATMMKQAETMGRSDGARSQPKEGDRLADYTGKITKAFETQLAGALKPLLANTGETDKASLVEKKERVQKKLENAEHELHMLKLDRQQFSHADYEHSRPWLMYAASWIISGSEAFFVIKSFAALERTPNWMQAILFVGFTIIFFIASKTCWQLYKGTKQIKNGILILAGLAGIILAALYIFASLRSLRVQNISDTTLENIVQRTHTIPAYYYLIISAFLMVLGVFIASQLPSDEDRGTNHSAKTLDKKILDCQATIERCERDLDAMPDKIAALSNKAVWQEVEASSLRAKYNAEHAECVAHYVSVNRMYRPDSGPSCLNDLVPDLDISI